MTELKYCDSWFWKKRKPVELLSEAGARKRHAKRQEYTVAIGGFEQPSIIVEVVNKMVAVTFMDQLLRMEQLYKFQEKEPNLLLLTMAVRRTFCEATPELVQRMQEGRKNPDQPWAQFLAEVDQVLDGRTITFKPNGDTYYRASRHRDARILQIPGPKWDFHAHCEPYPEFGNYDHLLKRERDLPWGPGLDGP